MLGSALLSAQLSVATAPLGATANTFCLLPTCCALTADMYRILTSVPGSVDKEIFVEKPPARGEELKA